MRRKPSCNFLKKWTHFSTRIDAPLLCAWTEQDYRGANQYDHRPEPIPTVRTGAFDSPEPDEGGDDINAAISSKNAPGVNHVNTG